MGNWADLLGLSLGTILELLLSILFFPFFVLLGLIWFVTSKHIELDCHVIREKIVSKLIHLMPISTKEQLADVSTKPLHSPTFTSLLSKLGLCSIQSPP